MLLPSEISVAQHGGDGHTRDNDDCEAHPHANGGDDYPSHWYDKGAGKN